MNAARTRTGRVIASTFTAHLVLLLGTPAGCAPASPAGTAERDALQQRERAPTSAGIAAAADPASVSAANAASAAGCDVQGDATDPAALQADVTFLASEQLGGRPPGTSGDIAARSFVEQRFRCLGLEPGADDGGYQQPFVNRAGATTANVIAILRGSDPAVAGEIVVVSAHHDHFGTNGGKGLRLGANDNASGVTAVLAAARAIAQSGTPPRRTLAFVTFGSEETLRVAPWVEGSDFYVHNPPRALPLDHVVHNVNLDMVGTYGDAGYVLAQGTTSGTPGRSVIQSLVGNHPDLKVKLGTRGDEGDSDFDPFCRQGIPYVGFWTDDPCYHQACDTADRLDYAHMASIARLVAELSAGIANSAGDVATASQTAGCTLGTD